MRGRRDTEGLDRVDWLWFHRRGQGRREIIIIIDVMMPRE